MQTVNSGVSHKLGVEQDKDSRVEEVKGEGKLYTGMERDGRLGGQTVHSHVAVIRLEASSRAKENKPLPYCLCVEDSLTTWQ